MLPFLLVIRLVAEIGLVLPLVDQHVLVGVWAYLCNDSTTLPEAEAITCFALADLEFCGCLLEGYGDLSVVVTREQTDDDSHERRHYHLLSAILKGQGQLNCALVLLEDEGSQVLYLPVALLEAIESLVELVWHPEAASELGSHCVSQFIASWRLNDLAILVVLRVLPVPAGDHLDVEREALSPLHLLNLLIDPL